MKVDRFKYLGIYIKEDGMLDMEVNESGRQVGAFLKAMGELLRRKLVPKRCRKVLYGAHLVSVLTCVSLTWTYGNEGEK